jgi:nicotinamidase-related amidase
LTRGYKVFLLADAIGSRKEISKDYAIKRMKNHGAEIITVEMMAFELLKDASHACFRNVSKIIK